MFAAFVAVMNRADICLTSFHNFKWADEVDFCFPWLSHF
jgi:hypothetical protein